MTIDELAKALHLYILAKEHILCQQMKGVLIRNEGFNYIP